MRRGKNGKFYRLGINAVECKRNKLKPTFAKPKISIKGDNPTKRKVTNTILEAELKNKHRTKKSLQKRINEIKPRLENTLGLITFFTLNQKINKAIYYKLKIWKNKLLKLFAFKSKIVSNRHQRPSNIIHNYSSYNLSPEEKYVLSFGLDHHISSKSNSNTIKTEFENFYYQTHKEEN